MPLSTNALKFDFDTADEVTVASPALIDGNDGISGTADINEWTNDADAPMASFVLGATWAAVPDSGLVELYCTLVEVEGTSDEPVMDAAFDGFHLGARKPDAVTSLQYLVFPQVLLPVTKTSQKYQFYIKNAQGDAAHDISAGWSLWVNPLSYVPK